MPEAQTPPFGEALVEAVKRITDQLLLYVLAGAMVVTGAAVVGPPGVRSLTVPLLLLLVLGLIAWTLLQTSRVRREQPVVLRRIRLRRAARLGGEVDFGVVDISGPGSLELDQRLDLGPGASSTGTIRHGRVTYGAAGSPPSSADAEQPSEDGGPAKSKGS